MIYKWVSVFLTHTTHDQYLRAFQTLLWRAYSVWLTYRSGRGCPSFYLCCYSARRLVSILYIFPQVTEFICGSASHFKVVFSPLFNVQMCRLRVIKLLYAILSSDKHNKACMDGEPSFLHLLKKMKE